MALADVLLQVKADTNQARQELNKFASDLNNLAKGLKTVFSDVINVKIVTPKAAIQETKEATIKADKETKEAEKKAIKENKELEKAENKKVADEKKKADKEAKELEKKLLLEAKEAEKKFNKEVNEAKKLADKELKELDKKAKEELKELEKKQKVEIAQFQKTLALDLKKTSIQDSIDKKQLDEKRLNEQKALEIKLSNELKSLNEKAKKENSELSKKLEADIAQAQKNQIAIKKQLEEKARLEKLDAEKKALEQQKEAERRAAQPEKDYKANLSEQRQVIAEINSLVHGFKNAINAFFTAIGSIVTDNPFIAFSREFEKNMYNMQSIALESTDNFKMLGKAIIDIAKTNQYSGLVSLSDSLYQAYSAGFKLADALTLVSEADRGALAGLTDSKTVLDALVSVIHAYGLNVGDASRINNIFLKTVQDGIITMPQLTKYIGQAVTIAPELKLNLENITAAYVAMTRQGLNAAETTTAINSVLKTFLDPSKEAASYAKELGVNLSSTAFEGRNFAQVISEIASKADEDLIGKIFGNIRAVKGFFKLAKDEGALFEQYYNEMLHNVNNNVKMAAEQQIQSFDQVLNRLKVTWEIAMQGIGQAFQDGLKPIINGLNGLVASFNDLSDARKNVVNGLIQVGVYVGALTVAIGSLVFAFMSLNFASKLLAKSFLFQPITWAALVAGVNSLTVSFLYFGASVALMNPWILAFYAALAATSLLLPSISVIYREYWDNINQNALETIENQKTYTENLRIIIDLEKKRIAQGNLSLEDRKKLALSYKMSALDSDSEQTKNRFNEKYNVEMEGIKQYKETEETTKETEKLNKEQADKQLEAYKELQINKANIKKTIDEALMAQEDLKRKQLAEKFDKERSILENSLTSQQLKSNPEQYSEVLDLINKLNEARKQAEIKLENELEQARKDAEEKKANEIKKADADALKKIEEKWDNIIKETESSLKTIAKISNDADVSKQQANRFLMYGLVSDGKVLDGKIKQAENYANKAKEISKLFGEIPAYETADLASKTEQKEISDLKKQNRKLDIESDIKALKTYYDKEKTLLENNAKTKNQIEYIQLKEKIKLNENAASLIDLLIKKGGLSPKQLNEQKELKTKFLNESKEFELKAMDILEKEVKSRRDKSIVDDLKDIDKREKLRTLSELEANKKRQDIILEKIQAYQWDIEEIEKKGNAIQSGIETDAYKQAKDKLEKALDEKSNLKITETTILEKENDKQIANEKSKLDRIVALTDNFASKLGAVADSLKQNNNGLISSFGSLLGVASGSYATASGYFKNITDIENNPNLTKKEKRSAISGTGNDLMTSAIINTIGENLPKIIDNTSLFYEKLDNLNKVFLTNSTSSKEFQTSLKGVNESISDNMKAIPGFGEMLSKLTRQVTDFLGVTDSEKTKAKNKTMLDLEYQLLSDRLKINNEYISNARLVLDKEFIQKKEALKKQGLEVEEFNARLELLELEYYANSYKIKNEQEQKLISLTDEYQKLTLSMNDSYFNKLEASNLEYIADEYEIWSQRIDGLISLAEAEQQILNAQLAKKIRDNQIIQAEKVKEYNIIFELEKAKLNVQEDNLNKSLELASLEREKKLWELNQEYLQKAITEAQGEKKLKTINLEYNSEIEKINKESKKKIQDINEKNYKEELKIIDKVYGEKRKKLQQEVDKETDIIKKAQDERLKLQENREIDQARKEKLYNAFTTDLAKKKSILTASFYTMNEEEASKGNVKILDADGLEKQFKGFETVRNAVLNDFETTSMTVDERNKQLTQNALEAFSYYQNLLNLETDPNKRVAIQETLNKYQKDYYEYSTDKEKDKIDEEEKQASKRLDMKQKELDTAYDLEQEQINNLNKLYLDSANVYKTAFVEASREWLAGVKNGLLSNDLQAQSEVIQAANNLFQNKTEAQKYIGSSSTNSSYPSAYTTSNYPSTNTTSSTPTSSGTSSTSTNVTIPSYTLSSLDTDQRKALLIKYLAQNDPTNTEQYYYDKYFYYDLPTLKNIVQERGVSYLIPQFDQFKDGGVANKPSIFGEAGSEAAFNYPQMVKMYDYIIKTTGNPINNNSSTIINMGDIHIQGTNLADAELVASAVNREFRNFENNIRRSK